MSVAFEDKLILNRDFFKARLTTMFEDLAKNESLRDLFFKNPLLIMKKYGAIFTDRPFSLTAATRLFFVVLSSPRVREWMQRYQKQLLEEHGGVIDPSKLDKVKIFHDFAEAVTNSGDIEIIKALIVAMRETPFSIDARASAPAAVNAAMNTVITAFAKLQAFAAVDVQVPTRVDAKLCAMVGADAKAVAQAAANVEADIKVCGPIADTVVAFETAVVLFTIVAVVLVAIPVAVLGAPIKDFDDIMGRREFMTLFEAIGKGLDERAREYRKVLEAQKLKGIKQKPKTA